MKRKQKKRILVSIISIIFILTSLIPLALSFMDLNPQEEIPQEQAVELLENMQNMPENDNIDLVENINIEQNEIETESKTEKNSTEDSTDTEELGTNNEDSTL